MKTSQMSFNLDQLTAWYMIGHLEKNIKQQSSLQKVFVTFGLVILLNFKVNVFFELC